MAFSTLRALRWSAVLLLAAAAGCAGKSPAAPSALPPSIVGLWVAEEIAANPVPSDARITLSLYSDGRAVGRSGCNNYFGTYKRAGDSISFAPFGATKMACAPEIMSREQLYFDTMGAVTRYERPADGSLILAVENGAQVRFRREEAAALRDARSRGVTFRAIGQEPGWVVELKEGDHVTVTLDYGATTLTLPTPPIAVAGGVSTYDTSTDTDHLVLKITDKACIDAMSGEPHPLTVEMAVNDKSYDGCGDWLK